LLFIGLSATISRINRGQEAPMKKFTLEELKNYKGENGSPVYVAVGGKVYDLSDSYLWESGDHQGEHWAGADLTGELGDAPHEPDRLDNFPVVGELE